VELPIVVLGGHDTYPIKTKGLPVGVGDKESSRTVETNFLIINMLMVYKVILGCLTLNIIKAIAAPYLLLIPFELDD